MQRSNAKLLSVLLALSLLGMARASYAVLLVEATVTPDAGAFHYEVAITNNTPDDVVLVSLTGAPLNDLLIDTSLATPAGFLASYDPLFGIVDFLADLDAFGAGTTVSGFSFDSTASVLAGFFNTFDAFTINGDVLSGTVQAQVVPEPATIVLVAFGLGSLILMRQRHGRRQVL